MTQPLNLTKQLNKITHLVIESVDRGIASWKALGNFLSLKFPNLEIFEMDQNYSYNRKFTDEEYIIDFKYFLQKMHYVKKMFISDIQSGFL